jgi:site-specific recombinase XerC
VRGSRVRAAAGRGDDRGAHRDRLAELRYDPCDRRRNDVDLDRREIRVRGKGGKDRTVRIDHEAARRVDRYLRARVRHDQAHPSWFWEIGSYSEVQ